jgi:hypothetical protein
MYPDRFRNKPTKRTPWIILEPGLIFIMGRSIPDNPGDFYRPVHEWVSAFSKNNAEKTRVVLGFEYINTSSTKWIYTILKDLSEMVELDTYASVTWYYELGDEDMCELGFILRSLVECPFVLVEVDEMNNARYDLLLKGTT